jgi:hypothetical protein
MGGSMTRFCFLTVLAVGCGGEVAYMDSGTPVFPIEEWSCSHNESQFSAYVEAQMEDLEEWDEVEFFIHDHDSSHSLAMWLGKDDVWRTNGNFYDLDCNSDNLGHMFVYYRD